MLERPGPTLGAGRDDPAGSLPDTSVVAPTFREAENLRALASRLQTALEAAGIEWELVLSDDDSGDGSEEIARDLGERMPVRMHVRRDRSRDLSRAVLDGIGLARADRLVVMDADLSHPPEAIPDLLAALDRGADMAVGSRYAPGGRVDGSWSRYRALNSRAATWLARPLTRCADPMSGFFALDRRRLPDAGRLHPIGYKIGLELMVRGELNVREVPIRFTDRRRGSSKLDWRRRADFLRHLHRLYLFRFGLPVRLLSFGAVGASGLVIDTAVYLSLQWLGAGHLLARFLSFWPAMTWNWRANRLLTFHDRPRTAPVGQWTRFAVASGVGLLTNVGSYAVLATWVAPFADNRLLALFAGVVVGSAANYLCAARFVYREHPREPGGAIGAGLPAGGRRRGGKP